jgi:hypothetical protein
MPASLIAAVVPAVAMAAVIASVIDATKIISIDHRTWTTKELARKYRPDNSGRLRRPHSQRNFAPGWRKKKQQHELIDSIFHNFPLGTAILNKVYDNPDDTDAWYDIYDGRHRIETIWKFVNNEFRYKGVYYKDLSAADRKIFDERKIPVTEITFDIETPVDRQAYILAEIFVRLNKGVKLTDSDLCWANRDMPMIRATLAILDEYEPRLRAVFGQCDIHARADLANWVALVIGMSTRSAANMTTSYLRIADLATQQPNLSLIRLWMDALLRVYERANAQSPVSANALKAYRKIGFVNAFFLAEAFTADTGTEIAAIVDKWVDILMRLRDATTSAGMLSALKTKGAQNLNFAKVTQVLEQVNAYLDTGAAPAAVLPDSDDEEEDDSA